MTVGVTFHGLLIQWVGVERDQFDLPAGACLQDLLAAIAGRYGQGMPAQLWDQDRGCFARQVAALDHQTKIQDLATPLSQGQEIKFMLMMGGG